MFHISSTNIGCNPKVLVVNQSQEHHLQAVTCLAQRQRYLPRVAQDKLLGSVTAGVQLHR